MKAFTLHEAFSHSMPMITVGTDTTARDALRQMRQHKIHHLVVTCPEGVLGILSDRQLYEKALGDDAHWHDKVSVYDAFTRLEETLNSESDLASALDLMAKHRCSALPIVRAGKLIGIVTETDLIKILQRSIASQELSAEDKGQLLLGNPLVANLMQLLAEAGI